MYSPVIDDALLAILEADEGMAETAAAFRAARDEIREWLREGGLDGTQAEPFLCDLGPDEDAGTPDE